MAGNVNRDDRSHAIQWLVGILVVLVIAVTAWWISTILRFDNRAAVAGPPAPPAMLET